MTTTARMALPVLVESPGATPSPALDGSALNIGLIYTRHCPEIVEALVMACRGELLLKGVHRRNIHELQVTMPFDVPYAMKRLLQSAPVRLDAVVCIGCLIRGESVAFEFVAEAVTRATMKIGMKMHTPVINGILTCTDAQQARHCAGLHETSKTRDCNFGVEWAQAAIEMGHVNRRATQKMVELCECQCHDPSAKERPSGGAITKAFTAETKAQACGDCGHGPAKTSSSHS